METPEQAVLEVLVKSFAQPADADDVDGVDADMIGAVAPAIDRFCRVWYRLEVEGMERVPDGPALLVGNHNAGITFVEALGMGARWYMERGTGELLAGLGHDAMFQIPFLGNFLVRAGGVRASHRNADRLFARGRKIVVFPGGNLEAFRPYRQRHRIRFGGRHGFLKLALRHRVPIVPVVHIGGHETFFVVSDGAWLARGLGLDRALRLDTFPLWMGLPWGLFLGPCFHLPLPSKARIRYLEPISMDGYPPGSENDMQVLADLYRTVTDRMQQALDEMASARRLPLLG